MESVFFENNETGVIVISLLLRRLLCFYALIVYMSSLCWYCLSWQDVLRRQTGYKKKRHYPDWEFSARQVNSYSFAWEMQGDSQVLPLQVFSTQDEVWLQFEQGQVIPAIFSIDSQTQAEQVLKIHRNPPYIVLKGHYSQLRLRWQDKEAIVWHRPR